MQSPALWDPLPNSSPCTQTAQVPRWAGSVPGGPGSIPGRFWRTGVPSFRRCSTEPLHSGSVKYFVMSLGHLHDHCTTGSGLRAPEKKKKNLLSNGVYSIEIAKCAILSTNCTVSCDTRAHLLRRNIAKEITGWH